MQILVSYEASDAVDPSQTKTWPPSRANSTFLLPWTTYYHKLGSTSCLHVYSDISVPPIASLPTGRNHIFAQSKLCRVHDTQSSHLRIPSRISSRDTQVALVSQHLAYSNPWRLHSVRLEAQSRCHSLKWRSAIKVRHHYLLEGAVCSSVLGVPRWDAR